MQFELWGRWTIPYFALPERGGGYVLAGLYVLASGLILVCRRRDFLLRWSRLLRFILLLMVTPLTSNFLRLRFPLPPLLAPPGALGPAVPLLASLPIILAAAWLGVGPALLLGLISGFLRAGLETFRILDPFQFAVFGFLAGFFLRQDYRGRGGAWLRQPVMASPLATVLTWPLLLAALYVYTPYGGFAALDYIWAMLVASVVPTLLDGMLGGVPVQLLYLILPGRRPVTVAHRPPPYGRTLNRRLLLVFVPLILIMIAALVYAVAATALRVATLQAVGVMARDARNASEGIPDFIRTGQGLLSEFAADEKLRDEDPAVRQRRLSSELRTVAFFDQLVLFDGAGNVLNIYPEIPVGDPNLTAQEQELVARVLDTGAPQISSLHRSERDEFILSFISPVGNPDVEGQAGALLGRTRLDVNPIMGRVLDGLQWTLNAGEGFVVDDEGYVIAHSDRERLLTRWEMDETHPPIVPLPQGRVYEGRTPEGARQLVCFMPVEGYPWTVVITLPYEVVQELAAQISTPLLVLLVLLGGGLVVVVPLVTGRLTRPLKSLAQAAGRIAEGDLDRPVRVAGDDEVARVGHAFEGMRVRLKDRLEDLSLLLRVSQAVSATLDLTEGMPQILEGALKATDALLARIVLLSASGEPQVVMARGEKGEGISHLDRALVSAAREAERPLIIENLARARLVAEPGLLDDSVKAVIALPVWSKDQALAVMWLGYAETHQFDPSEVGFLSTLASQTAVLVENARLFQTAEGGRRRLAAILSSTIDVVLVTDRDDRLLLLNPAAEQAFGVSADEVIGQPVGEAGLDPPLVRILAEPLPETGALTEEVPLPDGRTLYASVSTIVSADGQTIGRVAVMRDITHFKELDELKSEFVATVSHDLRAPLTFMRGYATMIPMVGELDEKQREYVDKILVGIEQMGGLIDDLLDLGRIEAGVGLERLPCHLGAILVAAVDGMRARAAAKGLTLRLEPAESVPVVYGDAALLRQAVTNLVDNGVKYTPSGGTVTVRLAVHEDAAIIRVSDTGLGITPEDQVRLFEKFYRVRRRETQDVQGTGLGLAIVKSIAERHGGRVWVESVLDEGSTFYIALPLGEGAVAGQRAPPEACPERSRRGEG